jgi:hypothetical protein
VSDNFVVEPQPSEKPASSDTAQHETQNFTVEASTGKNLAEELHEFLKNKSNANNKGNEGENSYDFLQRGLGVATVYIDNRSGGIHVGGDASFAGDASGRDIKNNTTIPVNSSSAKGVAGQVASFEIEKISSVYIQTDCYIQAKNILSEKHILILQGDAHLGKWTTAISLLSSLHAEGILEIDPIIEDLGSFECAAQQGYVIVDPLALDSTGTVKLRRSVLNSLSNKFRFSNSHLVIILDSRVQIALEDLDEHILNWEDLPASSDLLKKHLEWYLRTTEKLTDGYALMQAEEVCELLQQNKLLPGDVDRLAKLLAEVVSGEMTLNQALSRFSLLVDKQVIHWFEQHVDLKQRVLMVTLAVLSGTNYDTVLEASQQLQTIIKPLSEEDELSNRETELNYKLSDELKIVCAHLEKGYQNSEYGSRKVDLIVFDIPQFQPAILSYVWREYYKWREPLLTWLHKLASHSNFEVRARTAAAAGELSKYDFGLVLEKVLRPWAKSEDQQQRQLAALALSICVFEDELATQVLKLLKSWSNLGNNPRLALTVIAAYSGVGILFPGNALRDLFAIAVGGNTPIFFAVAESIVSLFSAGQYIAVLESLEAWTEHTQTSTPHQLGLVIFLELMQTAKVAADSNFGNSPTLLWLAKENKTYAKIVTCLLRRALNLKVTCIPALDCIRNWLNYVDYDSRFYPVLGRIIYNLVTDDGTKFESNNNRDRMLHYLKRWAVTGTPNAAAKILSTINERLNIKNKR